jgi:hypothetical protein
MSLMEANMRDADWRTPADLKQLIWGTPAEQYDPFFAEKFEVIDAGKEPGDITRLQVRRGWSSDQFVKSLGIPPTPSPELQDWLTKNRRT